MYIAVDYNAQIYKIRGSISGGVRASNGSGMADGQWHTLAFTSKNGGSTFMVSVDGVPLRNDTAASYGGLFTRLANADTLQVGGYQPADTVIEGLHGKISDFVISSEGLTSEEANALTESGTLKSAMFNLSTFGNTWLFIGGQETAGDYEHIGGIRNFVYQYEEYIRWQQPWKATSDRTLQNIGYSRFVANGVRKNQTLSDALDSCPFLSNAMNPKAVSYMPGIEDIQEYLRAAKAGGEAGWYTEYSTALKSLIDTVITNSDTPHYLVLQTPHAYADSDLNAAAEKITALINSVTQSASDGPEVAERLVVVDQYSKTNNDTFKNSCLSEDGLLNAKGHYEIAKNLSQETIGSSAFQYNADALDDTVPVDQPEWTDLAAGTEALSADFSQGSLQVTAAVQSVLGSSSWILHAQSDSLALSTELSASQSVTLPVSEGDWTLKLVSSDGSSELPSYLISKGDSQAVRKPLRLQEADMSDAQKKLQTLLASTKNLTWQFIGDSITHGSLHTLGYSSIVQLFDTYLHDEGGMNRSGDVVINTAVSGAIARETLTDPYKSSRLTAYRPDVAIIMLGMNDCTNVTLDEFESHLKENIEIIKGVNPDVQIILRTCNTVAGRRYMSEMVQKVRDVASQEGCLLVDHAATWEAAVTRLSNARTGGTGNLNHDALHPGGLGQKLMFDDLVKAMGVYDESSPLCRLEYKMNQREETSQSAPSPRLGVGTLSLDLNSLLENGQTAGQGEVSVSIDGITWTKTYDRADANSSTLISFEGLPVGKKAEVRVKIARYDSAVITTYAPATVTIPDRVADANIVFESAQGGYAQAQLCFENSTNALVTIERASSQDGPFEEVGSTSSNSYIDIPGAEITVYYRLKWTDNSEHVSEVKTVKTGMDVYKAHAAVYEALSNESFDGSKLVDLSEHADTVASMANGSLFFRFKTESTQEMALVYAKEAGTESTLWQTGAAKLNRSSICLRPINDSLSLRPDFAHTRADGTTDSLADGQWHSVVIVCNPGTERTFCWYIDGVKVKEFGGAGNAGFFSTLSSLNQLTVGGYYNGSDSQTVVNGFKGEIRDVIFSNECLSTAHSNQITAAEYMEEPDVPQPVEYDTTLLEMAIREAQDLEGEFKDRTDLDTALAAGQAVLENHTSQEQIDRAADALNEALLSLRLVPSKEAAALLPSAN